jgi:hypothetical protein
VQVRTDDEVYRVDAVWLGPPKATFPWRARYVAWGVGILVFLLTFTVQRWIGFGFGFFTIAWALVITVVLTRVLCSRISHERPLGAVLSMWAHELTSPREKPGGDGGAVSATRVRVHAQRPRPKQKGGRPERRAVEAPPRRKTAVTARRSRTARSLPPATPHAQPLPPVPPGWEQQTARQPEYQYRAPFPGAPNQPSQPGLPNQQQDPWSRPQQRRRGRAQDTPDWTGRGGTPEDGPFPDQRRRGGTQSEWGRTPGTRSRRSARRR